VGTIKNTNTHTVGQVALSILAGWTAAPSETWEIVQGALEDVGLSDIRPAPVQSLAFKPRHARQGSAIQ
jgi:hypothetical protein